MLRFFKQFIARYPRFLLFVLGLWVWPSYTVYETYLITAYREQQLHPGPPAGSARMIDDLLQFRQAHPTGHRVVQRSTEIVGGCLMSFAVGWVLYRAATRFVAARRQGEPADRAPAA